MKLRILLLPIIMLAGISVLHAITLTSFDDFSTTTDNWVEGGPSPNPPTQDVNPGWDGVTPGHLVNTSTGVAGAGGRQLMWNDNAEWLGDYITAGVGAIEMWVDNRSGLGSNLSLRIAFDGPGGWFVSDPQTVSDVTALDDWTQLTFSLTPANFTSIASGGTSVFNDTFTAVSRFEILISPGLPNYAAAGDVLQGSLIASDLRFDDIAAIPEPSYALLLSTIIGLGMIYWQRRRC